MNRQISIKSLVSKLFGSIRRPKPLAVKVSQAAQTDGLHLAEFGQKNVSMSEIYRRCYNNDFGVGLPPASVRSSELS